MNNIISQQNQAVVLAALKSLGLHLTALAAVGLLGIAVNALPTLNVNSMVAAILALVLKKALDVVSAWAVSVQA